jgi:serine/threonine-protein kinase
MPESERAALLALADEAAAADRWGEVAASLGRVVDGSPEGQYEWFRWAIARAATGDAAAYRLACRRLLDRFGAMCHPVLAERTAKACLILPLDGPELSGAVAVAERAVRSGEGHWVLRFARFARALAAYRSGDHAAALRWADLVLAEHNNHWVPDAATHLVRALALARLNRVAEAREALAGAVALDAATRPGPDSGNWHDRVYVDRLRAEAEALIGDAGFPPDPFAQDFEAGAGARPE